MKQHSVVLLLQDTTTLNFTGQKEKMIMAFDLVSNQEHAAGINNVATIFSDLIESLDEKN